MGRGCSAKGAQGRAGEEMKDVKADWFTAGAGATDRYKVREGERAQACTGAALPADAGGRGRWYRGGPAGAGSN